MTFGRNCQNQSEPCRTHDKCQNGGQCSYDPINNMMCTCDMSKFYRFIIWASLREKT